MSKFQVVAKAPGVAEITLYDVMDRFWGISAATIYDQLKELGDIKTIRVRINSPGGSVFEGTAIYNLLKQHAARVLVSIDGLAASMASIVAMAGDEIEIGDGAYLMIHDPLGYVRGDSGEMRDMAELLDKMRDQLIGIYARRTSQSVDQIQEWMKAETWMTAEEAIANKFADQSVAGLQVAAMAPVGLFEHPPQALTAKRQTTGETKMAENTAPKPATWQELKACCPEADADFLGKQMDVQATAGDAGKAWMGELQRRSEADAKARKEAEDAKAEAEKQTAEAKAEAEKAKAGKPGVEALGGGGKPEDEDAGDPLAKFNELVTAKIATGLGRRVAIAAAVRSDPDLHTAFLSATNRPGKAQDLIAERHTLNRS